jgi:hypothetical protein
MGNLRAKIYAPALNGVFADTFFDLGWFQTPHASTSPAAIADAAQPEPSAPAIEPTPLPAVTLAQATPAKTDPLNLGPDNTPVPGMEATTSNAEQMPAASTALAAAASPSVETPVASTASPAAARAVNANPSPADADEPFSPLHQPALPRCLPLRRSATRALVVRAVVRMAPCCSASRPAWRV